MAKRIKTCWQTELAGFPIVLDQRGRDSFRVTYGKEVKDRLSYGAAVRAVGGAIMHALACEGRVDNWQPGDAE